MKVQPKDWWNFSQKIDESSVERLMKVQSKDWSKFSQKADEFSQKMDGVEGSSE